MNKKQILIVYPDMFIGGSTTSLISLLYEFDYSRVDVDLLLSGNNGELMNMLPDTVHLLPSPLRYQYKSTLRFRKVFSLASCIRFFRALYMEKKERSSYVRQQITQRDNVRYCRKVDKEYDVAISYMELWSLYYLVEKVKAKKKIAWYHIDTSEVKMNAKIERPILKTLDHIILVAQKCKENFDFQLPEYKDRSMVIENMLSKEIIVKRSKEKLNFVMPFIDRFKYKVISVCRIAFKHKGLDRAVRMISKLKKEGILENQIGWYIVGDGEDAKELRSMIHEHQLDDVVFMCGKFRNPMPLVAQSDIFLLPSHYEGKPMAVTEAQMLDVVPFVTHYQSAPEQICDGENGVIMPNSEEGIYLTLKKLCLDEYDIDTMKKNLEKCSFTNADALKAINNLIYK